MTNEELYKKANITTGMTTQEDVLRLRVENKKLKTRLRTLKPCGYCKHLENEPPEICTPCLCGEVDNWEMQRSSIIPL